jgi:arsenical pump membrane protein
MCVEIDEIQVAGGPVSSNSKIILPAMCGGAVRTDGSVEKTGITDRLAALLSEFRRHSATMAAWASSLALAVGCNLMNNLPAGLVAGRMVATAHRTEHVRAAILISVGLNPNLSITGSLATYAVARCVQTGRSQCQRLEFFQTRRDGDPPALLLAVTAAL